MAGPRLKNTLSFANLAPGASVVLPHGLMTSVFRPLAPDVIFIPTPDLDVASDKINVTLTNVGAEPLSGSILVEAWHTIERTFSNRNEENLPVKPYIVVGVENGNAPPQPPFTGIRTVVVYARMAGSDVTGDGLTPVTAFRTLQRAVREVPSIIPAGVNYIVDISGVGGVMFDELLPSDFVLPVWKAPIDLGFQGGDPYFRIVGMAVAIQATPRLVSTLSVADATINSGDVLSTSQDPLTKLWTITLNVARPAWGTSSPGVVGSGLKGKFAVQPPVTITNRTHPIVGQNTPSTILLSTPLPPVYPIRLMEPSAHLHASGSFVTFATIAAVNNDSIGFNGLKITSDDGSIGLFVGGMGQVTVQLCELESPLIQSTNDYQAKILTNWFYGFPSFQCGSFQVNSAVFDNTNNGPFFIFGPPMTQPSLQASIFDNADPISYGIFIPFFGMKPASTALFGVGQCLIRGSTGPGISWHGGNAVVNDCDIYGCAGPAIEATLGHGVMQVLNCGSSGGVNGGAGDAGVFVNDGAHVKVNAATVAGGTGLTPLQGGAVGQDMQVGAAAAFRTWAGFAGGGDGRPAQNEFDIPSAAATGATGTGSRLYE